MNEVSISIRGRDDGAGRTIDNLREKVRDLGKEAEKVSNVRETVNQHFDPKKDQVRQEFRDAREASKTELNDARERFNRGEMTQSDYGSHQRDYQQNMRDLDKEERLEIRDLEIEQNETLREILEELRNSREDEETRRQNDNTEFNSGGVGNDGGADTPDDWNGRTGGGGDNIDGDGDTVQGDEDSGGRRRRNGVDDFGITSAAGGDLTGAGMGFLQGAKSATGLVRGLSIAGIIAIAIKELLGQGDKVIEAVAPTAAMRGGIGRAGGANEYYAANIDNDDVLNNLGLNSEDFASRMLQKAQTSGISGAGLRDRALNDAAFEKGFGADSSQFSQFERFTKGQEDSLKIAMDVLNVLTSIKGSQLTEGDLTLLSEKLNSQNALLSIQRQKRDIVDADSSLRALAAFESIGLSAKGDRSANFLENTVSGLGEGGSDNVMMLKFEAAKRARPDLANDPAALRRMIRFNSDDPDYMNEAFKLIGDITGGDDLATDDALYSFFPGLNEKDLEIYKKAMKGGNFSDLLKGKGMASMKQRKATLSEGAMMEDAQSGVGLVTQATAGFGNLIKDMSVMVHNVNGWFADEKPIDVSITSDKTKPKNSGDRSIPKNSTYKKGGN